MLLAEIFPVMYGSRIGQRFDSVYTQEAGLSLYGSVSTFTFCLLSGVAPNCFLIPQARKTYTFILECETYLAENTKNGTQDKSCKNEKLNANY